MEEGIMDNRRETRGSKVDSVRTVGGLIAVAIGALTVTAIALVALLKGTDTAATIAGSSAGVIGSIVGAFFGVKIGTDQTRNAIEAQREEAMKAQVYAAHLPAQDADRVLETARSAAAELSRR
jgi:hypothetical protein